MRKSILFGIILLIVPLLLAKEGTSVENLSIKPDRVYIGATYHGTSLQVKGTIPTSASVVIRVRGENKSVEFKEKGKVFGLLWMNKKDITMENIPELYLLFVDQKSTISSLGIGYPDIKREMKIIPPGEDKDFLFKEFLKLKQKEGLYAINEGSITYQDVSDSTREFSCEVTLPSHLHPGSYFIDIIMIADSQIISNSSYPLKVEEKGFPLLVSTLAFEHGALYGIAATLIAIAVGLLIGVIFKKESGAH